MNSFDRKKLFSILITVAAVSAVISVIATVFFRTSLVINVLTAAITILEPFLYGIVIAYLLHPLCQIFEKVFSKWLEGKHEKKHAGLTRMLSIALSLMLLVLCLLLLVIAVLPELIRSITSIVSQIPDFVKDFSAWINTLDQSDLSHEVVYAIQTAVNTVSEYIENFLENGLLPQLQTILSGMTTSIKGILDLLKNLGLGLIISAYILGSWEKFVAQIKLITYAVFPVKTADWLKKEAKLTDRMFSGFVHGKLLDSAIIGGICFLFTMLTGMPYALLISIVVGVTNMIPFFGPYIGAIPSALLLLTVSPQKCVIFVIFVIILQQLDGNVIGPKILGDRLGLSGFWILFSILIFGSMWGIVGMLIGAPVFAVLYDLIRRTIFSLLGKKQLSGMVDAYEDCFHEQTGVEARVNPAPKGQKKRKN